MFDRFTSLLSLIIFLANSEACMRSPASGKIYDFTVTDIDGNEVQLKKYLNKVCIIVNVATDFRDYIPNILKMASEF
uniref:Glutathione peroxidase n=1 Tax=Schistosoma mansoni TaxID=6183 RepID=A0A5K4FAT9_SCHMA